MTQALQLLLANAAGAESNVKEFVGGSAWIVTVAERVLRVGVGVESLNDLNRELRETIHQHPEMIVENRLLWSN
jgi:hypothetical protein